MTLSKEYLANPSSDHLQILLNRKASRLALILGHGLAGYFMQAGEYASTFWAIGTMLLGTYLIITTRNSKGYAHFFAGYIASLELFTRMTRADLFWEFGKYGVIYFLLLGLLFKKRYHKKTTGFLLYFYFLTPAILKTDSSVAHTSWRELISFNLSGPAVLCISGLYFFRKEISIQEFKKTCFMIFLPLLTSAVYLIRYTSNLTSLSFSDASNFKLSGNYGPNQVSTVMGFAFCFIILIKLLKIDLTGKKIADWVLAILFFSLAVLTFSRGGVLVGSSAAIFAFIVFHWGKQRKKFFYKNIFLVIIGIVLISQITSQINLYTQGFLEKRYSLSKEEGHSLFTGRQRILEMETQLFKEHLILGVGVGMSGPLRQKIYGYDRVVPSHTEYSRMLAEHGLFGLVSLIIMIYMPLIHFSNVKRDKQRLILVTFICFSLLTISHSAMRLAMVSFFYGMAFITLKDEEEERSYST